MIVYRTLRQIALALRYLQVLAFQLQEKLASAAAYIGTKAVRIGDIAKGAAGFYLARREDKAYAELDTARRNTEAAIEALLMREDSAEDNVTNVLADNAELRRQIFTEVL
jgi:hypothetical protein